MSDVFTSIKTTGGWADQGAAALAYDLMFRWALRDYPVCRQFADVRPEDVRHQAKAYRIFLNEDFAEATVTAAMTPLDEETDVSAVKVPTPSYVDLTPKEYGFGTVRTLKLKNRALVPIDPVIARAVAYHQVRVVDGLVQAQLQAGSNQIYGGDATSADTVAAGDVLTAQMCRQVVTRLRASSVQPRDGIFYAAVIHPHTELSLRTETGAGSWRNPQEYGSDQRRLWTGEIGEFEGLRFVTNPRTNVADNATSVPVYKSYFMGREALAEAVNVEPEIRIAPVVDKLHRNAGIGWYGDLDFARFREEALIVANTTLTAADATALGA